MKKKISPKKILISIALTIILSMFSSCDYMAPMDNTDVLKLSLVVKEFSKNEQNFTNYYKHVGDIDTAFEEKISEIGDVKKYLLVSKDVEKYYENNTMYVFDKLKNTKLKSTYKFEALSFGDNIKAELIKIQNIIQDEYLLEMTGRIYSLTSMSIFFSINAKMIFNDGFTDIEYSEVFVSAHFGKDEYLESLSVTYRSGRYAVMTFETGPELNFPIDFQDNLNTYR